MKTKPLSFVESMIFASGDAYGGGAPLLISFYYLIFLTDVVGLRPGLAGLVILISRVWDAISDPVMGVITDNTKTRWGRRKPYFFVGFFGIIASFFLLWYPIQSDSTWVIFGYVLFAYIFHSTVITMVAVPYTAMSSEISTDTVKRNNTNGARLFFSQISSLLCAVLPLMIVERFADVTTGYLAMALIFGVFFATPFLFIFFFTRERIQSEGEKSEFSIREFMEPFKIRSFRILIGIYLTAFLTMDIVGAVFAFYMKHYLNRPEELNFVLGAMLITQIILVPVVMLLANRIGKARTLQISISVMIFAIFVLWNVRPHWPDFMVYMTAVIMGMGIVGGVVIPWIMYPDVTDVGEFMSKRRKAGSFAGIMTFMRKLSSAAGIFAVAMVLDLAGYLAPVKEIIDGKTVETLVQQPDSVITAIKIIIIVFPLLLLGTTMFFSIRYPLSYEVHNRLKKVLTYRRDEEGVRPTKEEINELEKILL